MADGGKTRKRAAQRPSERPSTALRPIEDLDAEAVVLMCECGQPHELSRAEAASLAPTLVALAALGCHCGDGGRIVSLRLSGSPPRVGADDDDAPF